MTNLMKRRRALMGAVGGGEPTHGTWEDLYARIADGTYATAYSVGEILPLDLGTEGVVNAQIVAFNADDKADDSGKAKISFISKYLLKTSKRWNPALSPSTQPYTESTGTIGGYEKSEIRAYINNTIKPLIPNKIKNRIVEVTKYSTSRNTAGTQNRASASTESVWLPSEKELGGTYVTVETSGISYVIFSDNASRIKSVSGLSNASYWTRTAGTTEQVRFIDSQGRIYSNAVNGAKNILIGFCID